MLPKTIDLAALRRIQKFSFYFRYPLHPDDFAEIRTNRRRRGYFAAKPLYGKLTTAGHVDRSAGLNGQIAAIFIPSPARSLKHARLLMIRVPRAQVTRSDGRRNWPAIRRAAEEAILKSLGREPPAKA